MVWYGRYCRYGMVGIASYGIVWYGMVGILSYSVYGMHCRYGKVGIVPAVKKYMTVMKRNKCFLLMVLFHSTPSILHRIPQTGVPSRRSRLT
jgi:hypothetical protein